MTQSNTPFSWNLSPTSGDSNFFDGVDDSNATVTDFNGVLRRTFQHDGANWVEAVAYNVYSLTIYTITYARNGETVAALEDLNLSYQTYSLYSGQTLFQIMLNGNDAIYGGTRDDRVYGYGGDDYLWGGAGNDVINGGGGLDTIDGGTGIDTAEYFYSIKNYGVSKDPRSNNDAEIIFVGGSSETLSNIEKLSFSDGVFDVASYAYIGESTDIPTYARNAVHRFYNTRDKAFFYTASAAEKDYVLEQSVPEGQLLDPSWPYVYQGGTFAEAHSYLSSRALVPLHRFYNTDTGHHFFTANSDEKNLVIANSNSGEWPFNYEGVAFNVYSDDPYPNFSGQELAVHRLYSPSLNRHFFTGDTTEVEAMQLTGVWNYEGIGFWGEII